MYRRNVEISSELGNVDSESAEIVQENLSKCEENETAIVELEPEELGKARFLSRACVLRPVCLATSEALKLCKFPAGRLCFQLGNIMLRIGQKSRALDFFSRWVRHGEEGMLHHIGMHSSCMFVC